MTNLTNNKAVLSWIDEMTAITKPDKIVWITGEEDQISELREQAVREGILIKLNPDKLPGCYLHRTDPDDVARVEDRTFICCEKEEDAGPTNHWMEPKEMYKKMYALADGAYKGRTMYIIPYSMSIIGSPFAKYGFELTDSIYVVLNMHIMTRVGKAVCDALGDDTGFIKGLHCQCNLDKDNKYIVHFPQDNTIISMNSNYGGNVLQGKKCFALRIASNLGRQEGWMAEHMLILGIQNPRGEIKYISAAFPSACGKTNLAMLIPPEGLQRWGWRVWCVGARRQGRQTLGGQSGERLLRCGARYVDEVEPQRAHFDAQGYDLYERRPRFERQHRLVGGAQQDAARPRDRLARPPVDAAEPRKGRPPQQPLHRAGAQLPVPEPGV